MVPFKMLIFLLLEASQESDMLTVQIGMLYKFAFETL